MGIVNFYFKQVSFFNQQKHMGDADYLAVFHHILLPIAYEVTHWFEAVLYL